MYLYCLQPRQSDLGIRLLLGLKPYRFDFRFFGRAMQILNIALELLLDELDRFSECYLSISVHASSTLVPPGCGAGQRERLNAKMAGICTEVLLMVS
jgi:hypothetical protein